MKIISSYTLTDLFLTLISALILILGIVVGYSISTSYEIKAQITTANSSSYLSILYHILATNFSIIAFVSILGYITCGVLSISIIFYNGIRIGETLNTNSDSVWNVLKFVKSKFSTNNFKKIRIPQFSETRFSSFVGLFSCFYVYKQ